METLLKSMLTYNQNGRLSWETFFFHHIFDVPENYYNEGLLGANIFTRKLLDTGFENFKEQVGFPKYNYREDPMSKLIESNASKNVASEAIQKDNTPQDM